MAVQGTLIKANAPALYDEIQNGSALSSTQIASGDYIGIADVSASEGKKITVSNLANFLHSNYFNNSDINKNINYFFTNVYASPGVLNTVLLTANKNIITIFPDESVYSRIPFITISKDNSYIKAFNLYVAQDYSFGGTYTITFYNNNNVIRTITHNRSSTGTSEWIETVSNLTNCTKIIIQQTQVGGATPTTWINYYEITPAQIGTRIGSKNAGSTAGSTTLYFRGWYIS